MAVAELLMLRLSESASLGIKTYVFRTYYVDDIYVIKRCLHCWRRSETTAGRQGS